MHNKFIFANQLRGIAAILVVMTHYFGTFFAEQALLAERTFSPNLHLVKGAWVHWLELEYQGPFGVAIFFLISGFVIPYSLQKNSKAGFLLHRALRIFPTYAASLALGTLAIYLSAHYWGQAFTYDARVLAANALLVHNLLDLPSMDAVNWTLSIEVKFYLLAALGTAAFFSRRLAWQFGFQAVALGFIWYFADSAHFVLLRMELNYILFMLIGVLFYQHVTERISSRALVLRSLLSLAVFSASWAMGPQQGQFPGVTVWYYCALAVFGLCYALRARFRPLKVLDFFADISYPLYCVHSLFGYCLMKVLIDCGMRYGFAVLCTLAAAIALAWLLHQLVEQPTNRLGRRLADALPRRHRHAVAA